MDIELVIIKGVNTSVDLQQFTSAKLEILLLQNIVFPENQSFDGRYINIAFSSTIYNAIFLLNRRDSGAICRNVKKDSFIYHLTCTNMIGYGGWVGDSSIVEINAYGGSVESQTVKINQDLLAYNKYWVVFLFGSADV